MRLCMCVCVCVYAAANRCRTSQKAPTSWAQASGLCGMLTAKLEDA